MSGADDFADCPFAYWCGSVARLEPAPRPGAIVDPLALGSVAHEALRRATEAVASAESEGCRLSLRAAVESAWDGATAKFASGKYPALGDERSRPLVSGLRDKTLAAAALLDGMDEALRFGGMERRSILAETPLPPIEMKNSIFTGRADRIDFWARPGVTEERAVIFDYKLGGKSGYTRKIQLACYAAALRRAGKPVAGFRYVCLGDASDVGAWSAEFHEIMSPDSRGRTCEERIDTALDVMTELDAITGLGRYEARYESGMCRRCGYQTLCRRGESRGEYFDGDDGDE
jgi:RecB family exonuclease